MSGTRFSLFFFQLDIANLSKESFESTLKELAQLQVSGKTAEELKLYTMPEEKRFKAIRKTVHSPKVLRFDERFVRDLGEKPIKDTLWALTHAVSGGDFDYAEIPQPLRNFIEPKNHESLGLPTDIALLALKLTQYTREDSLYCNGTDLRHNSLNTKACPRRKATITVSTH